jgi:hypothetical protein
MDAEGFGYVIGASLMMYAFFLIFLGLLALIHPLRFRFGLRNGMAWLSSSIFITYLLQKVGGDISLLFVASMFAALGVALRYIRIVSKVGAPN